MNRTEHDALGEMELPATLPYGIQTLRAVQNFGISGRTIADIPHFVRSIAQIKKAAARANARIGVLPQEVAAAIEGAADEVIASPDRAAFPVDIFHGGGGTSANMNLNEVIGLRANELMAGHRGSEVVHPNTHVNMGQSTNDVIPAAMKMSVRTALASLARTTGDFGDALERKEAEFAQVLKLGRTCLQDALPITLGQQFSGYRSAIRRHHAELERVRADCLLLPLGATAVGTGFGTFPGYQEAVYRALHDITGDAYAPEDNFFDGLQNADVWITISAVLKALALTLSKLAADLRLMSSGPRAGLAEVALPAVQPGSSIMPGKVNPVMPEMVMQVYFRVLGNDASVTRACEGELDLNVWESLILLCVSESISLLDAAMPLFARKCIEGIQANAERTAGDAGNSLAMSTVVATLFDYEKATSVAARAARGGTSVQQAVVAEGLMTEQDAARYLDPKLLTSPRQFQALFTGKLPASSVPRWRS